MKRRAKRADEPILNRTVWWLIVWSAIRTTIAYSLIFFLGLLLGGETLAKTMIFTAIVLHAFTRIMVVRQMDNLSIWSNPYLLLSYALSVSLQVMLLYTPLREVFGVVALPALAWAVLVPIVIISSTIGVYHSRWILRRTPMW
jgi:Ca2+-transporting ATPase